MDWLHWIGRKHYSIERFMEEGKEKGVSRRISLGLLKKMEWGDTIYCIQKKSKKYKSGSVFARFPVERITGLSDFCIQTLVGKYPTILVTEQGDYIERECGDYQEGVTLSIKASISVVARMIESLKKQGDFVGKPMIGCNAENLQKLSQPWGLLKNIPFSQGFRRFDSEIYQTKWLYLTEKSSSQIEPSVYGKFSIQNYYSKNTKEDGEIQEVIDYKQKR